MNINKVRTLLEDLVAAFVTDLQRFMLTGDDMDDLDESKKNHRYLTLAIAPALARAMGIRVLRNALSVIRGCAAHHRWTNLAIKQLNTQLIQDLQTLVSLYEHQRPAD